MVGPTGQNPLLGVWGETQFKYDLLIGAPHDLVSERGPEHCVPHSLPGLHVRVLVIVPDPHLTEQALQAPKAPICALTGMKDLGRLENKYFFYFVRLSTLSLSLNNI